MKSNNFILTVIVLAQFCCTSIWFASNAVMGDLILNYNLSETALGHLTSAVQFGFISGTLFFAIFMISDRFSPSKVFGISALFAALFNTALILDINTFSSLISLRFLAGFALAGIYPVGMKIAADYFPKTLGLALGFLVGALVLGTSFPHLLKGISLGFLWTQTIVGTSILSVLGGTLIFFLIKDGPYRKAGKELNLKAFFTIFKNKKFKAAAFGYFGHMWELYAFWAFIPVIISYNVIEENYNVAMLSFCVIAIGSLACIIGGFISQKIGLHNTARYSLMNSMICCLICPFILLYAPFEIRILFLLIWGMFVISDSPMFSSLVASSASSEIKGSALTIVNCIGFAITILSIQLLSFLTNNFDTPFVFMTLGLGGIFGLASFKTEAVVKN